MRLMYKISFSPGDPPSHLGEIATSPEVNGRRNVQGPLADQGVGNWGAGLAKFMMPVKGMIGMKQLFMLQSLRLRGPVTA